MVKKGLVILVICISVVAIIICYLPIYLQYKKINSLEKQANYLIQQVEVYKKKYHKIPEYMEDMKLNLPDDYPLYYNNTQDSGVYIISFQVEPFKSMGYHSDSKTWVLQH